MLPNTLGLSWARVLHRRFQTFRMILTMIQGCSQDIPGLLPDSPTRHPRVIYNSGLFHPTHPYTCPTSSRIGSIALLDNCHAELHFSICACLPLHVL